AVADSPPTGRPQRRESPGCAGTGPRVAGLPCGTFECQCEPSVPVLSGPGHARFQCSIQRRERGQHYWTDYPLPRAHQAAPRGPLRPVPRQARPPGVVRPPPRECQPPLSYTPATQSLLPPVLAAAAVPGYGLARCVVVPGTA